MSIEEILECVECAKMELDYVKIRDLPDDLQQDFIQAHELLSHISTVLDLEMELDVGEADD